MIIYDIVYNINCSMLCILSNYPGLYAVAVFLVVLAATSWLFFGIFLNDINSMLRVIMILIGVVALLVMPCSDLYLPFLSASAIPANILADTEPRGTVVLELTNMPPNVKVMYWAAKGLVGAEVSDNPKDAYNGSINGGVTTTSDEGTALLTLDCPVAYHVSRFGIDKVLPKHVHFRYELPEKKGLFSRVQTEKLDDLCGNTTTRIL
jgi:hypothetical protein